MNKKFFLYLVNSFKAAPRAPYGSPVSISCPFVVPPLTVPGPVTTKYTKKYEQHEKF